MRKHSIVAISLLWVVLGGLAVPVVAQSTTPDATVISGIRHELLQLPYYGVFDFLSFKYSKGTVDLMGYAYRPTLKSDAERALKRVAGVEVVNDQVEVLPVSINDDDPVTTGTCRVEPSGPVTVQGCTFNGSGQMMITVTLGPAGSNNNIAFTFTDRWGASASGEFRIRAE